MNLKLLIDGLVRQTTVLIAQLSTTSGVRSPLSQVADQVFLQLAQELETQGVSRAVAADMFGLALRTYQRKIARATESMSAEGMTLWEAIYNFVKKESPTRKRLLERFRHDGEREVTSVLHDLVSEGLVFATGRGAHTVYGPTSESTQATMLEGADAEALAHVVWLRVFQGVSDAAALAQSIGASAERIERSLEELTQQGLVENQGGRFKARNLSIPVGSSSGFEAAMLDHFRAVCHLLVSRSQSVADGRTQEPTDGKEYSDGGSTFGFTVYPGHPFEAAVQSLLSQTRDTTQALWEKVAAYNTENSPHSEARKITFYCGQVTTEADNLDLRAEADAVAKPKAEENEDV